jgi:hypothetical protein
MPKSGFSFQIHFELDLSFTRHTESFTRERESFTGKKKWLMRLLVGGA